MTPEEMTNRVSIYAAPDALDKLKYDWLDLSLWDSKRKIARVLEQLGLSGDVTVFKNSPDELTFIQGMKTAFVMHFFTTKEQQKELAKCYIPGFTKEYDHSFALVNNNKWFFYRLDLNNSLITPCFATIRYKNGIVCEEIVSRHSQSRVSFVVELPFGCVSIATILLDGSADNINNLDKLSPQLLHKLGSGNYKDIFKTYQDFKNILYSIVSDYEVTIYNESNRITDSIRIKDETVVTFTMTFNSKTITANNDGSWNMNSDTYYIEKKKDEIEFKSSAKKDDYKQVAPIYDIIEWVENFIDENMNFAFNL